MKKLCFFLIAISFISDFVVGAPLSSFSQGHDAPQVTAPKGLLQFILDSEPDDAEMFNRCVIENNLTNASSSKLFIVSQANLTKNPNETYFVRPALKPFCMAFYEAHLFRFWFVKVNPENSKSKYSILLQSGGDAVSVLTTETKGYKDLRIESHTAMELYTSVLKYDGSQYQATSCTVESFETKEIKPCK